MKTLSRPLVIAIQLALLGLSSVVAQEARIDRQSFSAYLEKSENLTKNLSFRSSITFEMSDHPNGGWKPYSSMVLESVFPNRAFLSRTSGMPGEFVRIGTNLYIKEGPNAAWSLREGDGDKWLSPPVSPSAPQGFQGPYFEYTVVNNNQDGMRIKVVSKPNADSEEKVTSIYLYSFDNKGILINRESIMPNGNRFTRKNETFEYDQTIRIEVPID